MVAFRKEALAEVEALCKRYPARIHALLPVLHLVQRENAGWIPAGWPEYVAKLLGATVNHVRGVITFYNMFKTRPVGKHHILVCTCVPCGLCSGDRVLDHVEERLGIGPGQTTADGLFSLEESQCLAACDRAPLMLVNDELRERVTPEAIDRWIDEVRRQAG